MSCIFQCGSSLMQYMHGLMTFVTWKGPKRLGHNFAIGCDRWRFVPSSHICWPSVNGRKWRCPFFLSAYFWVIACACQMVVWAQSQRVLGGLFYVLFLGYLLSAVGFP